MSPGAGLLAFAVGAVLASAADAALWRSRRSMPYASGRSACERCGHGLSALELVPVLSWVGLRGRCRHCGARVAARHLAGELAGGLVAVALLWLLR